MPQSGLRAARIDPMITEIRAPKTGLTAETLRIIKWHKGEGEFVENEEILLTVETEKTTLDIVAPRSGFLKKINFLAGEEVVVSEVIGLLATAPEIIFNQHQAIINPAPVFVVKKSTQVSVGIFENYIGP